MKENLSIFGTDGVRGHAFGSKINPISCLNLAASFCLAIEELYYNKPGLQKIKIAIAMDSRESCEVIRHSIIAGVNSLGFDIIDCGVVHIGALSSFISHKKIDGGIMISASHNIYSDNGLKFFDREGRKISSDIKELMLKFFNLGELKWDFSFKGSGSLLRAEDVNNVYTSFLKQSNINLGIDANNIKDLKFIVDCANGATYKIANIAFEAFNLKPIFINNKPNGKNINKECGATSPKSAQDAVLKHNAQFGICFDGDGDRLLVIDEKGNVIEGEKIIAFIATRLKNLPNYYNVSDTIVTTVASNSALIRYLNSNKFKVSISNVGDKFVLDKMIQENSNIGGEESGHIIIKDILPVSDGIISALCCIFLLIHSKEKCSIAIKNPKLTPSIKYNIPCKERVNSLQMQNIKEMQEKYDFLTHQFNNKNVKILIRPSGTEPKIRVSIESEDEKLIEKLSQDIKRDMLNVI